MARQKCSPLSNEGFIISSHLHKKAGDYFTYLTHVLVSSFLSGTAVELEFVLVLLGK